MINKIEERIKNNDVAIVWYHKFGAAHTGIAVGDKPYGFFCAYPTEEAGSLTESIKKRIDKPISWFSGPSQLRGCHSITVQYLNLSPEQKIEIQNIVQKNFFPCLSCMHAVARILGKTTDIQIPSLISSLPNTSLIYLQNLQNSGSKTLSEQITFGNAWTSQKTDDQINRVGVAAVSGLGAGMMALCCCPDSTVTFLSIGLIVSLAVLYKTHVTMSTQKKTVSEIQFHLQKTDNSF